jgi:hypothetical protein
MSHGLSSEREVLPDEDADQYAASIRDLEADLRPRGALERQIVHRIGSLLWRLARIERIEEALWDRNESERLRCFRVSQMSREMFPSPFDAMRDNDPPVDHSDAEFIASQFEWRKISAIERLAVYEQRLDRQLNAALRQFRELRKMQNEASEVVPEPGDDRAAQQGATLRNNSGGQNDKTNPPQTEVGSSDRDGTPRTPVVLAPPGTRGAHPDPGTASSTGVREARSEALREADFDS